MADDKRKEAIDAVAAWLASRAIKEETSEDLFLAGLPDDVHSLLRARMHQIADGIRPTKKYAAASYDYLKKSDSK